ncbi:unnamed protein product, partial [Rotaria magnacalcarata]
VKISGDGGIKIIGDGGVTVGVVDGTGEEGGKIGEGVEITGGGVETKGNDVGFTGERGDTTGDTGRVFGFFCSITKILDRLV